MEAYEAKRNIAPLIRSIALHGRQWSSTFTPCLIDTLQKWPQYLLKRSLGGSQSLFGHFTENLGPCQDSNPSHQAHSPVTIPTTLSQFPRAFFHTLSLVLMAIFKWAFPIVLRITSDGMNK